MSEYQFQRELSPRNIILDLMGVSHPQPLEAGYLNLISDIFNIPVNNLRVALTRLAAKGMLDNTQRGVYRLSPKAMARNEFARRWKQSQCVEGEWNGSWIGCHLSKGANRSVRSKSLNALSWFGFKPGLDHLWVRPNNLLQNVSSLQAVLKDLGLESQSHVFSMDDIDPTLAKHWKTLWPVHALNQSYSELNQQLLSSYEQLDKTPLKASLLETCVLGSEAIHFLATDPQLPSDIRPSQEYETLRKTMIDYDLAGRKIWLKQLSSLGIS